VLGLPVDTIVKAVRLDLAESALHATIACRDGNGFDWLPLAADDPDGEETCQLMLVIAAAPFTELKAVEADVGPGSPSDCTSVSEASLTAAMHAAFPSNSGEPSECTR
jgi:hypothetical protein